MKEYLVVWKYEGKEEKTKSFTNFTDAMRFQANILKKKKGLEYAKYQM